jgi:GPR1/FUN34/yaaH family
VCKVGSTRVRTELSISAQRPGFRLFAVGFLGLVETGIVTGAADGIFIATCFGIGAIGLFIGGMWEFRGGELFGGAFGVGYAGFLFSTALILKLGNRRREGRRLVRPPR